MAHDEIPPEAWKIAAGPLGVEITKVIASYATPIFWAGGGPVGTMHDEVRSGTTFFLDLGEGPFGVTAGHVYDRHAEAAAGGTRCQIGLGPAREQRSFDLRERLIARGRRLDLATYRISPEEIARARAQVRAEARWPPSPPTLREVVRFSGFPRRDRSITSPGQLLFGTYSGAALVDSVNSDRISCLIPHEYMVELPGWKRPQWGHNTAGMSGGPMFLIHRGAIMSWTLAGVICEGSGGGHQGDGGPFLDMVQAVRADFINADGTLIE